MWLKMRRLNKEIAYCPWEIANPDGLNSTTGSGWDVKMSSNSSAETSTITSLMEMSTWSLSTGQSGALLTALYLV
jgi:hypothetical protein